MNRAILTRVKALIEMIESKLRNPLKYSYIKLTRL